MVRGRTIRGWDDCGCEVSKGRWRGLGKGCLLVRGGVEMEGEEVVMVGFFDSFIDQFAILCSLT